MNMTEGLDFYGRLLPTDSHADRIQHPDRESLPTMLTDTTRIGSMSPSIRYLMVTIYTNRQRSVMFIHLAWGRNQ